MNSFRFIGGSQDGNEVEIDGEPPAEIPIPELSVRAPGFASSRADSAVKRVEVYVLRDASYYFSRYDTLPTG